MQGYKVDTSGCTAVSIYICERGRPIRVESGKNGSCVFMHVFCMYTYGSISLRHECRCLMTGSIHAAVLVCACARGRMVFTVENLTVS